MHRSGTSALTRVINLLGAGISTNLMPGAESNNPSGFWESTAICEIHNKLFEALGIEWFNLSRESLKEAHEAALVEFKNGAKSILKEELPGNTLLVLKDPRICILAKYWIDYIEDADAIPVAVLPIRNPLEVATSLGNRDNIDTNYSLLLWLRHFLDSERHTRDIPRSFCSFNSLIADWKATVDQIATDTGIIWPNAPVEVTDRVEDFLSPESKHHNISDELLLANESIPDLVKQAYIIALDLVRNGDSQQSRQKLDSIGHAVNVIEQFSGQRLVARDHAVIQLEAEVVQRREDLSRLNALAEQQSLRTSATINEKERTIQRSAVEISEKERTIQRLSDDALQLQQLVAVLKQDISTILGSWSWRISAPARWLLSLAQNPVGKIREVFRLGGVLALEPIYGLQAVDTQSWVSTCDDPQFRILNVSRVVSRGWYRFHLKTRNKRLTPRLYFDHGHGYSDQKQLLPYADGYTVLCYFKSAPAEIRIDPLDIEGVHFELSDVTVSRVFLPRVVWSYAKLIYNRDRGNGRRIFEIAHEKLEIIKRLGPLYILRNLDALTQFHDSSISSTVDYAEWIGRVEHAFLSTLKSTDRKHPSDENQHVFIMFADSMDDTLIYSSIQSLINQTATDWTTYIFLSQPVEHAGKTKALFDDPRIVPLLSDSINTKYSQLCAILKSSDAAFATLIGPNCRLAPDYLSAISWFISEHTDSSLICYSDSDTLGRGGRKDPAFKPNWSPDYFIEHDYIGPVCTVSTTLFAGALELIVPDYDDFIWQLLIQVAIDSIQAKVERVPYVLWHKVEAPEYGAAGSITDLLYDSRRNILDHLLNNTATVSVSSIGRLSVKYSIPVNEPTVEIIIPTHDQVELLSACIESLTRLTEYTNYNITVVNNRSKEDATLTYFKTLQDSNRISVVDFDLAFNFSAINNKVALHSQADFVCFLNNDIEITNPDWLNNMVSHAARPAIGCVGAKLIYPDREHIQHAGVIIGLGGVAGHAFAHISVDDPGYQDRVASVQNYSAVTAACMVMRTELFKIVGGFDEKNLSVAFNDVDICLRVLEKGYRNIWTPDAELIHHESISRGSDNNRLAEFQKEVLFMQLRWQSIIQDDPAYNPNFSLDNEESFSISLRQLANVSQAADKAVNPALNPYALASNELRISELNRQQYGGFELAADRYFATGLSIVILTLDKPELIGPLLLDLIGAKETLGKQFPVQIIVGDTGSTNSEVNEIYAKVQDDVTIIKGLRYHFSACNNELFLAHVKYDSTLFLNNDIIFDDAAASLSAMYNALNNSKSISVVGTYLLYPDNRLQHGGVSVIEEGDLKGVCYHPGHREEFKEPDLAVDISYPAVTGACLMIESTLFHQLGMFDELYSAEAQDVDLCFRTIRLGKKVGLVHAGRILHLENATRDTGEANNADRARFVRKWAIFYEAILRS